GTDRGPETGHGDVRRMGPFRAWLAGRLGAEAIAVAHHLRWCGRSPPIRRAGGAGSESARSCDGSAGGDPWWRRYAGIERAREGSMMTKAWVKQSDTDARNAVFWNELCGSALARSLGITDSTAEGLRRFDEAYMAMYPYLSRYVTDENLTGK